MALLVPVWGTGFHVYLSKCWVTCWQVQSVWWDFFLHFFLLSYILNVLLPPSGLGSRSTSLSRWFCVCCPRQYDSIYRELHSFFKIFWFIFVYYFHVSNLWMYLVSCMKQEMLCLERTSDSKCKLNIPSFLYFTSIRLPYLFHI